MPLKEQERKESYKDRTGGPIYFTSPDGSEYVAKYISDERTKAKRLQLSEYIGGKKTHVRDLGIGSPNDPVSFYFDGPDCDLTAQKFWDSCDETGQWGVNHPIHGFQSLQLVSVTHKSNYVASGGVVEFLTEWIEPKNKEAKKSKRQLKSKADGSRKKLDNDAAVSFAEKVDARTESLRKSMENFTKKYTGIIDKSLSPVASLSDAAFLSYISSKQMLNDFQFSTQGKALALAGQFQGLIQTGLMSTVDVGTKNRACKDLTNNTIGSTVKTVNGSSVVSMKPDPFGKNEAALIELISVSVLSGICESALDGNIETARDGIDIVNNILERRGYVIQNLETIQTAINGSDKTVDTAYIQNEETIKSLDQFIFDTIEYVMFVSSSASAKKTIVLENGIPTIVFFLRTYKRLTGFESFCDSNDLNGSEILFLPSGKEIQI